MLRNLLASIQFLTILPCGPTQPLNPRQALPLFPLCGLLIGALLVLVDAGARMLWDQAAVVAVVDVVALAAITGALHLDGLADTADGLYGHRAPEKALAIMKDSRIGAMGMIAVACCLAVKWAGLSALDTHRVAWLLLVPAFARASALFGIRWLPYGRPQGGTGHPFFEHPLRLQDFWGCAVALVLSALLTGWGALWIAAGFALLLTLVLFYYKRKINCITGDMLGAMIEIMEAAFFLLLSTR